MKLWEYRYKVSEVSANLGACIDSHKAWCAIQADEGLLEELIVSEFEALAKLVRDWQDCYLLSRSPISEVPE
jgi:hypothetical protein